MTFERPPHASHHCRHYHYDVATFPDGGPRCARGVDLSGPGSAKVCMPDAKEAVACNLREEHTEEEHAAWKAWRDERLARMIVILAQMPGSSRDKKNKPEWGNSGRFPCPGCKSGTVSWARARSNGHLHAGCSTPHCFGIIE